MAFGSETEMTGGGDGDSILSKNMLSEIRASVLVGANTED